MESIAYVITSGWASGINVYATILVTGLIGRLGDVETVPPALQRTDVLIAAALLCAVEFVVDKIPYLDSTWDAIHTAVRPSLGAVIGALVAGEANDLSEATGAVLGGGTALASHAAKAGLRLAVNTSPEPASNILLSLSEDAAVVAVVLFAVDHPEWAAGISLAITAAVTVLVVVLFRRVRATWRRLRARGAPP